MGQDSHYGPSGMYPPMPPSSPPPSAPELQLGHMYPPPPEVDPPRATAHVYPLPLPPQMHPNVPPVHGYPQGPYVVPSPVAYPSKDGPEDSRQAPPPRKAKKKIRGHDFWRVFWAGMCCCCCLDIGSWHVFYSAVSSY